MQVKHKQIAQSVQLTQKATDILSYLANDAKLYDTVVKVKPKTSKSRKEGGERICIKTGNRYNAEQKYRAQARAQLRKAAQELDKDHIVDNISFCCVYDWRW